MIIFNVCMHVKIADSATVMISLIVWIAYDEYRFQVYLKVYFKVYFKTYFKAYFKAYTYTNSIWYTCLTTHIRDYECFYTIYRRHTHHR